MTVLTLEKFLRKLGPDNGYAMMPKEFQKIGAGIQKTAYVYTLSNGRRVVVKRRAQGFYKNRYRPPTDLRKYGLEPAKQWQAGEWVIQEFTTPLRDLDSSHEAWTKYYDFERSWNEYSRKHNYPGGDFHAGNVGWTDDGLLVSYDW